MASEDGPRERSLSLEDGDTLHAENAYDGPEPSITESRDLHLRSPELSGDEENGYVPLPVWMRESSKSFRWRSIPLPIRKFARNVHHYASIVNRWSYGPTEAQVQRIEPLFPIVQEAPLWLVERYLPKRIHRLPALLLFYLAWLLTFCLIIRRSAFSGNIEGYGTPSSIWCGANFWSAGNDCGLNGNNCRPFADATFTFRCSGDCLSTQVLSPYVVGDQAIVYKPLVIGGPSNDTSEPIYRADSFICQAATHAGIVSNTKGGCGVAYMKGSQPRFEASYSNGLQSIGFDAEFPKSYTFLTDLSSDCGVVDMRWPLLGVTVSFTVVLSLFDSSPAVFFFSIFVMLFIHVGFVSDKPNIMDWSALASLMVERFLPACFVAFVFYRYCIKRTLKGLTAQLEKTILWLGGAWVGSLNNYTFKGIPIQRLTPHDIQAQPGAVLALVIIVVSILFIALGQIYFLRLERRFRRYLALYAGMGVLLLVCVFLPTLNLRIHHYILAILFLPGTSMQTRPSLFYQGLLMGLFINGVARWGFDSLLQTSAALFMGGPTYSLLPNVTAVPNPVLSSIHFSWDWPPAGYDGLSMLVNDVERYRWYIGEGNNSFTWKTPSHLNQQREFFRFAYMRASDSADYTEAGIWEANGTWIGVPDSN